MILVVPFLLFGLDFGSLLSLCLETTSREGLCVSSIIFEDWSVVQVSQGWDLADDSFSVVWDIFNDGIVLEVEHSQVGKLVDYLLHDSRVLNAVVLDIKRYYARALK